MRRILLIIAFLALPSLAAADMYYWTDSKGVLHIVDAPEKVPPEYREGSSAIKSGDSPSMGIGDAQAPDKGVSGEVKPLKSYSTEEDYGGKPFSWWKTEFVKKKSDIKAAEDDLSKKKQFVEAFEGGRRFGQIYSEEAIKTYTQYKADIPAISRKLESLNATLEELNRKATIYGVPKAIR